MVKEGTEGYKFQMYKDKVITIFGRGISMVKVFYNKHVAMKP